MKKFIITGVIFFLAALIATIPASVASKLLPGHISAHHYHGNLWNGSATSMTIDNLNLGSVAWKVKPSCLFFLNFCVNIEQQNSDLSSSFLLRQGTTTQLENLNASGDARILNTIMNDYGITLSGQFEADLANLSFSDKRIHTINGDMRFSSLSINGVLRVLLGNLSSQFEPRDEHTLISITNNQGHVDLSGVVQLFQDMSYAMELNVRKNQRSTDAVINGMQYIGDRQSDGSVKLVQNGKLAI